MSWDVMTTEKVAEALGVSPGRVRQLVTDGLLQPDRSGRTMLFEKADVDRYQSQRRKPGRPARKQTTSERRTPPPTTRQAAAPEPARQPALADLGEPTPPVEPPTSLWNSGQEGSLAAENARLTAENERLRAALKRAVALVNSLDDLTHV